MSEQNSALELILGALPRCGRSELRILRDAVSAQDAKLEREEHQRVAAEIRRLARSINARAAVTYPSRKRGRPRRS